jgi:hypothetical protein
MKRILRTAALLAVLCALVLPAMPAQAQSGNTWSITYWPNLTQGGFSPFQASSSQISFNWGFGSPMNGIPADNFSMRATSSVWFQAGTYTFNALADDEISLMIDGATWINTRNQGLSGKTVSVTIPLTESRWYNLQVDYREFTQTAYVFLNWSMVGAPPAPVQPPTLAPAPSATDVQTQFGNYTPCIQQGLHQQECFVPNGQWDSPNQGSIAMEPQIVIWGNCNANTIQDMRLFENMPPQSAKCSKTEAGWFPR